MQDYNLFLPSLSPVGRHEIFARFDDGVLMLREIENLFQLAGLADEHVAAGTAIDRVKDRLQAEHAEPEIELKFSLPDVRSVRLFVAVCRKHNVRPYRYPHQRRSPFMVRTNEQLNDDVVWMAQPPRS